MPEAGPTLDYEITPPRKAPSTLAILIVWLWPVAFEFTCWFFVAQQPRPYSLWINARNFVRGIVGFVSLLLFSLGLTDPNTLDVHVVIAAIIWPLLLATVTVTRVRRLALPVHAALSMAWSIGGCLAVFAE